MEKLLQPENCYKRDEFKLYFYMGKTTKICPPRLWFEPSAFRSVGSNVTSCATTYRSNGTTVKSRGQLQICDLWQCLHYWGPLNGSRRYLLNEQIAASHLLFLFSHECEAIDYAYIVYLIVMHVQSISGFTFSFIRITYWLGNSKFILTALYPFSQITSQYLNHFQSNDIFHFGFIVAV